MDESEISDFDTASNSVRVHRDREWWRCEARRCGSNWPGVLATHAEAVAALRARYDPQYRKAAA